MINVNITDRVAIKLRKLLAEMSDRDLKAFYHGLDRALKRPAVKPRVTHTKPSKQFADSDGEG